MNAVADALSRAPAVGGEAHLVYVGHEEDTVLQKVQKQQREHTELKQLMT